MDEGPITKKIRIWNPAVTETTPASSPEEDVTDEKPLDCSSNSHIKFSDIFQNYLQLAPIMMRLQQQRQMEEFARRQFMTALISTTPPVNLLQPTAVSNTSTRAPGEVPTSSGINLAGSVAPAPVSMTNPIVATVLGNPLVNENCCAVCGAVFRLTGDLVQHMRNNHRKNKFKRKAEIDE